MAWVSGSHEAKWKYVKTSWSFFIKGYSDSMGSFTLMIISAWA